MKSEIGNDVWGRLSPLLDQVLELSATAREPWLRELAKSNPELAAILRELLAEKAALDSRRFLENSPAETLGRATLAGQHVGAYEIDKLIGQGGMGAVWLAHRCDGRYEGKAAVKLLNAALIGGPAEQRFIREGSVLAALQHPNIAHLIDAGVTAGGHPYLILEHVEGKSIDKYCQYNRLGVRARLRVFLDVLNAVAYAHRHLVVHRDLKPSNVLVTPDGIVKLLDFGVAALLEPAQDVRSSYQDTREIGTALTPEYAAPEQLLGQTVTTASDIYALGRVLYVLLGGSLPATTQKPSAAEIIRNTLERELPLLSEAAVGSGVKRLLRGDLDNIVAKALKREPAERYLTVDAFAGDLRHYLANEPVSARPDSLGYRVGKFIRRHRGGVFSGALTALVLVFVTGFAVVQMLEAQRQRDEAQAERQRADGFSTAMTSLLSQLGPGGRPLRPDELLQRAVEQVEATYADDPSFLVHMLILISGRYYDLRDTNLEYATLVRAEQAARKSGNPALVFQVQCNTVETELAAGRKAEAARRLDEALGLVTVIGDVPVLDHAACLRAQAEIASADGDVSGALEHLEKARGILEAGGRTKGNVYAGILSILAAYNGQTGNALKAHEYHVKLVELDERLGRENSMPGVIARGSLAMSFRNLGQVQRAYEMHLDIRSHETTVAPEKISYAEVLNRLGMQDVAIGLIRDALADVDNSGHQRFRIHARLALTQSLLVGSSLEEARQTLAEATSLMLRDEAANRRQLADADLLRAGILLASGRPAEAQEQVASAARRQAAGDLGEPLRARILLAEARVRLAQGSATAAAESARAAARLFEHNTIDPAQSADVGEALLVLAQAESALGEVTSALRNLERAGTSLRNGLGADHSLTRLSEELASSLR